MAEAEFEAALAAATRRHLEGTTGIADLRRLSAGASQETWSFDAAGTGAPQPLILRRAPGGVPENRSTAIGQVREARLIQICHDHGVKAPNVRYVLEEEDGLGVGFVMDRVAGETLAPRILRDDLYAEARPKLAGQCGEVAASIHAVPMGELDFLPEITPEQQWRNTWEAYEKFFLQWSPSPVFDYAFRWLKERVPARDRVTLVHGDFRNGNIIFGPEGVRVVLDWEIAHFGDPMEDLAWICVNSWRFGNIDRPVGGFGRREELFEAYERASGVPVDPERVKFWEIFGSLRWGVTCRGMAFTHLTGHDRSVERPAIGRRSSECEADLMILLGRR
ncbi:MAG: phosphotransferase [Alphaproteobacteria bacterium]|nr:phosphotransferase [Alphaproteobacteria bacterium]